MKRQNHIPDTFNSVQKYTGEVYFLADGEKIDKIAEGYRPKIDEAAQRLFHEKYQIEVKAHNVVDTRKSATVFLGSRRKTPFYIYAVDLQSHCSICRSPATICRFHNSICRSPSLYYRKRSIKLFGDSIIFHPVFPGFVLS
ncbi:DUF1672 family protein [Cytobacillus firmus]|uniref:DUF1672 family protein n=1 Tax=Cytobacillus firmus TaxID=1399 RepID=UPI0018CCA2D4|nr:hypothetical protein [Cytobacillus firmus]